MEAHTKNTENNFLMQIAHAKSLFPVTSVIKWSNSSKTKVLVFEINIVVISNLNKNKQKVQRPICQWKRGEHIKN